MCLAPLSTSVSGCKLKLLHMLSMIHNCSTNHHLNVFPWHQAWRRNSLRWPAETQTTTTRRKKLYFYLFLLTHGAAHTSFKHTHSCSVAGISAAALRLEEVQSKQIFSVPRRKDSKRMLWNALADLVHSTHQGGTQFDIQKHVCVFPETSTNI